MFDVLATKQNIMGGNDQQIDPHEEVGKREVFNIERVHTVGFSEKHASYEYLEVTGVNL